MVSLGGFEYSIDVNTQKGIQSLDALVRRAQTARSELDRALSGSNPNVNTQAAQQSLGHVTTKAQEAKRAADFNVTPRVNTQQAQSNLNSLGAGFKQLFALGAGVAGVSLGIGTVHQALAGMISVTQEATQAQFALNATYGSGAAVFTKFADDQARALGRTSTEFKQAAVAAATLTRNYGLTAEQVQTVIRRSTDLAAVQGIGVADATNRVTAALRGEAEAAELLGLTLNSDAIKAIAEMTDEQRKNWETLDGLTKAQITYREFLRQTAHAEEAATKAANEGLTTYDQTSAAFNELGVEAGTASMYIGKGLAESLRGAAQAAADYLKERNRLRSPALQAEAEDTRQLVQAYKALREGNSQPMEALNAARRAREEAEEAFKAEERRKEVGREAERQAMINRTEANRLASLAREEQAEITRIELERLGERRAAAADAAREERERITDARDADIAASNERRDAALAALEREAQARSRARTQEDRERSAAQEAELRGLEQIHEANLRGLDEQANAIQKRRDDAVEGIDAEIRAVDRKRDAALRAIDEETRAESRRHDEALRHIDAERDRRLGIIDAQLRQIDEAAQQDQRRQTDQSLARSLSDARRDFREAETPAERARAQRAISDAEAAIQRERVNRRREDARDRLRDQADQIREAADTARRIEDARNRAAAEGLQARQRLANDQATADTERLQAVRTRVEAETKIELDSIKVRIDAERAGYEQTVQDARDAHQAINNAIADRRRDEDAELAERRTSIQRFYAAEQADIKAVADTHLRALEQSTRDTLTELDKQKKAWDDWARAVQKSIADAITAGDPSRIEQLRSTFGPFDPPGYRESVVRPTTTPGSLGTQGGGQFLPGGPRFGQHDAQNYLVSKGYTPGTAAFNEQFDRLFEFQMRGYGPPPDMIVTGRKFGGLFDPGRAYLLHKDEMIFPQQAGSVLPADVSRNLMAVAAGQAVGGRGGTTFNMPVHIDARGVQNPEQLVQRALPVISRHIVNLLDAAERGAPDPAPETMVMA